MRISDWSSDVCSSDLRFGYPDGSRGRTGLVVAVGFGSYFGPVAILPANVPNKVVLGAAEVFYGVQLQYFYWLIIHLPVLWLLTSALRVVVVWMLFREGPKQIGRGSCRESRGQ